MLNPDYYNNHDIRNSLTNNGIVVLENAILPDKAEALYAELQASKSWHREYVDRPNEEGGRFTYTRDKIQFDSGAETNTLAELRNFMRSDTCLDWVTMMSGLSCFDVEGSAASMGPGDYLGKHNDNLGGFGRVIAYVLYLTKDWKKTWGGEFIFESRELVVPPAFNQLVMFRVNRDSYHSVNKISNDAITKRLAIVGWFNKNTQRASDGARKVFQPNWEMPTIKPS